MLPLRYSGITSRNITGDNRYQTITPEHSRDSSMLDNNEPDFRREFIALLIPLIDYSIAKVPFATVFQTVSNSGKHRRNFSLITKLTTTGHIDMQSESSIPFTALTNVLTKFWAAFVSEGCAAKSRKLSLKRCP